MILAIVDDLLFRGKLEVAAAQLGVPLTIAADVSSVPQWTAVEPRAH